MERAKVTYLGPFFCYAGFKLIMFVCVTVVVHGRLLRGVEERSYGEHCVNGVG